MTSPADDPAERPALVTDLLRPEAHPEPCTRVELVETHLSWVFLAGERVAKVKKPVRFDFVDFSSLEQRRQACEDELRLNRRLAPDTYLGVLPVTRGDDGRLRLGGDGPAEEWCVHMRRLPADGMLDRMLERGDLDDAFLRDLAGLLARFHDECARGPDVDAHGTPDAVTRLVLGNVDELAPFASDAADAGRAPRAPAILSAALLRFLRERLREHLENHADLLRQRVTRGHIVEGHGDLHAGNICRTDAGIVAYDALEFSHAFRCGDVANDIAFLAMDMERRGFRAFARHLVKEYAEISLDPSLPGVLLLYKTHRALVRAKVLALAAGGRTPPDARSEGARRDAMGYVHLAAVAWMRPCVVLLCGLPGTGKSWLARRIALALDARTVRSDTERKSMAGVPPTEPVPEARRAEVYGPDATARLHERLRAVVADALRSSRSVVVDATFGRAADRRDLVDLAQARGTPWLLVHVRCDPETVRARMEARAGDRTEVSDADWTVYRAASLRFEPPTELAPGRVLDVESPADPDDVTARLLDALLGWQDV